MWKVSLETFLPLRNSLALGLFVQQVKFFFTIVYLLSGVLLFLNTLYSMTETNTVMNRMVNTPMRIPAIAEPALKQHLSAISKKRKEEETASQASNVPLSFYQPPKGPILSYFSQAEKIYIVELSVPFDSNKDSARTHKFYRCAFLL